MKKIKLAISHACDKLESISATVANINYDQRVDGSGSSAELSIHRTLRVPEFAHILTHLHSIDSLKSARSDARDKQVRATASQRKPETFCRDQVVAVQKNVSKLWNIRDTIVYGCCHHGLPTDSYIIRCHFTGRHI